LRHWKVGDGPTVGILGLGGRGHMGVKFARALGARVVLFTVTLVGAPEKPLAVKAFSLLFGRRSLSGSGIGGIAETQARLDFCTEGGVAADVDVIRIEQVNDAYERLLASDVTSRFVVDTASLNG
jgi:D-arabinose 1-dehydrogenase-like Zn-dependent alcohol dehydrogenase